MIAECRFDFVRAGKDSTGWFGAFILGDLSGQFIDCTWGVRSYIHFELPRQRAVSNCRHYVTDIGEVPLLEDSLRNVGRHFGTGEPSSTPTD